VVALFTAHVMMREPVKLPVDERRERLASSGIAAAPGNDQIGDRFRRSRHGDVQTILGSAGR